MAKKQTTKVVKEKPIVETNDGADETVVKKTAKEKGKVFTYVGGGEDSPRVINFMGRQKFVRGQATEVTDPKLLAKIVGCPTFVEGEVDPEDLHNYDEEEKLAADKKRKEDKKIDAAFKKHHHGE